MSVSLFAVSVAVFAAAAVLVAVVAEPDAELVAVETVAAVVAVR